MRVLFVAVLLVVASSVSAEFCYSRRWFSGVTQYSPVVHGGEMLIYTHCGTGYEATSKMPVRCIDNASEEPLPQCKKVNTERDRCWYRDRWSVGNTEYIPVPHQGRVYIHTTCREQGYFPDRQENIECVNGYTEKKLPLCQKVVGGCPILSSPLHGSKSCTGGRPVENTICSFECSKNYYLRGSQNRTCLSNHHWTGRTPWCLKRPECPVPPPLIHGKVIGCSHGKNVLYEDTCSFQCNPGFELKGPSVLYCRLHRRLTDEKGYEGYPQCIRKSSSFWTPLPYGPPLDPCSVGNGGCDQICRDVNGVAKCSCREWWRMTRDGKTCEDIDECALGYNRCQHTCENVNNGYKCSCREGYRLINQYECERIEPSQPSLYYPYGDPRQHHGTPRNPNSRTCGFNKGGCSQICNTVRNGVECRCYVGYQLDTDGKTCNLIDECRSGTLRCSHSCVKTPEGTFCSCYKGFKLREDGRTCEDIDECSNSTLNLCEQHCHNIPGNYTCYCNPGYVPLKDFKCQACRYNSYRSSRDDLCVECPPNSYTKADAQTSIEDCHCSPGFSGDLARNIPCEDIDECLTENFGCSHKCVNTPGDAFCVCSPGFELQKNKKTCQDVDECMVKNGGCQGSCHNTNGSFYCSCAKGYKISDEDGYSCIDVDECLEQNGGCSDHCINFPGSYHCSCPEGYHLDGKGKSCIATRCPKFLVPHHSIVRCFDQDSPANKTFFRAGELPESMEFSGGTLCRVVCNKGYQTDDDTRTIECQADGKWNATLPDCEELQCPPLGAPENGDVHPPECLTEAMPVKARCYFTCHPDHRIQGEQMLVCKNNLTWKAQVPRCVPIKVVPFISCPEDFSVSLQSNESSATLTLPPPHTNMDHFQVDPEWVIVDEPTVFQAGQTDVTFSVTNWKNRTISCQMSVTVSDGTPPVFDFCPESFDVGKGDVYGVRVDWDEPIASDNVGIKFIQRNLEPNSTLTPGIHFVEYIAEDFAGNVAKCSFQINVSSVAECSDLADPENGEANCIDWMVGKICEPVCNPNYTLLHNEVYACDDSGTWHPSDVIPPCLPECPLGEIWSIQNKKCEENTDYDIDPIYPV